MVHQIFRSPQVAGPGGTLMENTVPCLYDLAIVSIDPKAPAIVSDCGRYDAAAQPGSSEGPSTELMPFDF
jgi:hypothetical protein